MMRKTIHILITIMFLPIMACTDDNQRSPIDNMPVYIEVYVNGGRDAALIASGGHMVYTKQNVKKVERVGFAGVLAVRGVEPLGGTGVMNLWAYDRACPHEARTDAVVEPISVDKGKCNKCGSEYNILSGGGFIKGSGPSKNNLKIYSAVYSGDSFVNFKIVN